MIIRAYGHSTTETLVATPWKQFLETLYKQYFGDGIEQPKTDMVALHDYDFKK